MDDNFDKEMTKALQKKALGYTSDEVVEEYTALDGEMQLSKRKVTTKFVAPDIAAYKALQETNENKAAISDLNDEELEEEKARLTELLKNN